MVDEETLARKIHEVMTNELASAHGRLRKVVIRCESIGVPDAVLLNEHWRRIATEPVFESSFIEVHADPPFGRCALCHLEFEIDEETSRCPKCSCEQFTLVHEPPTIETYEMEESPADPD
jgi:Zn finger protein HypA/HybF involved in hydrogenase expression